MCTSIFNITQYINHTYIFKNIKPFNILIYILVKSIEGNTTVELQEITPKKRHKLYSFHLKLCYL